MSIVTVQFSKPIYFAADLHAGVALVNTTTANTATITSAIPLATGGQVLIKYTVTWTASVEPAQGEVVTFAYTESAGDYYYIDTAGDSAPLEDIPATQITNCLDLTSSDGWGLDGSADAWGLEGSTEAWGLE